jgi:hypothetical protein
LNSSVNEKCSQGDELESQHFCNFLRYEERRARNIPQHSALETSDDVFRHFEQRHQTDLQEVHARRK